MSVELIGFASGMIGSLSILPQIYKSWVSGSSNDLSTNTIVLMYIALILAVIYGIMINHSAIYITNIFSCILYVILHGIKIRNERKKIKDIYIEIDSENETEINLNEKYNVGTAVDTTNDVNTN
jgi:MtN3 and saliva related transmembrane protein